MGAISKTVIERSSLAKSGGSAKVHKGAQVDTLASQAMKDVASCDKLGGAAN